MGETTFRHYFTPEPGIPPREADLNEGFIQKVDADVHEVVGRLDDLDAQTAAMKTRVDAVITDQGASSTLKKAPPEFLAFSVGSAALSPGNPPVLVSPTKFRVNGNWLGVFTVGRRVVTKPATQYFYVLAAVPVPGGKTEVTLGGGLDNSISGATTDVQVGVMQYGMPRLSLAQIPDDFIPPEKLTDPPALEADLTAAVADLETQIDGVAATQDGVDAALAAHAAATTGVHGVAPGSSIETTAGATTKVSTHNSSGSAHSALVAGLQATSGKGANNGYAGLDSGGKVPAAQLPGIGLKAVQRGETALNDGSLTVDSATFTAVTPGKAFVIITVRGSTSSPPGTPKGYQVTAEFKAGNAALTFKRADNSGNVLVSWQVVEFY